MKILKLLVTIIILLAFTFTGCSFSHILSQEEIADLRAQYPLSEIDFRNDPMDIDMDAFDTLDSFVIAKDENYPVIIGTIINSDISVILDAIADESSKDNEIKEKILEDKEFNIEVRGFQTFEIIVEEDPILPYGDIKKGDVVTIHYTNYLTKNNPFTNGTKGIFSLYPYSSDILKTTFGVYCKSFFYITDKQYVIGNMDITANKKYTGKKLNRVINMIKEVESYY